MATKVQELKRLIITIEGSDRKRKAFEKDLRTFIKDYKTRAGVKSVKVQEENLVIRTLIHPDKE